MSVRERERGADFDGVFVSLLLTKFMLALESLFFPAISFSRFQ
jgi:hypothetical protein